MKAKRNIYFLASIGILTLLLNCKGAPEQQTVQNKAELTADKEAIAIINGASGSNISGEALFTEVGKDSVKMDLSISNATPGSHAVHLHINGDCSAPDAISAKGHWNPTNTKHGKRGSEAFHKGDIANMTVNEDGKGSLEITVQGWSIGGAEDSDILDKAVIIHAGPDDFTSQPSGAAGERVACGVIELKLVQ